MKFRILGWLEPRRLVLADALVGLGRVEEARAKEEIWATSGKRACRIDFAVVFYRNF